MREERKARQAAESRGFPGLALAEVAAVVFPCVCLAAAIFVGHFTRRSPLPLPRFWPRSSSALSQHKKLERFPATKERCAA